MHCTAYPSARQSLKPEIKKRPYITHRSTPTCILGCAPWQNFPQVHDHAIHTPEGELHHHVRLNAAFRSDLQWWAEFSQEWNGVSRMTQDPCISPQPIITSDASGNWGCGAFNLDLDWFQLQWPNSWSTLHITVKELAPIVIACAVWGRRWQGRSIHCVCDNAAVVSIITSGSSRDATVMHLMWCLFFFQAVFSLSLHSVHLPGK